MNKLKQFLISFFTDKRFETFLWITLNGFLGYVGAYLLDLNIAWAVLASGMLNIITKHINVTYLKD